MKTVFLFIAMISTVWAQSDVEQRALQGIQQAIKSGQGRVSFSELHNDDRFGPDERAFLGRLYEIFFQIPSFLKSEFETSGKIPTRQQMSSHFEVSPASIELLLRVTEMDRRVPSLFDRDPNTREITALNLDNISAFVAARGDQVRVTQWEGQMLPPFELPTLEGKSFSSKSLEGKPALIYFWFTGCPPCVRIAPILAELDRKYRPRGFQIVGMNADKLLGIDTTTEQMSAYLKKNGTEYPNLMVDQKVGNAFGHVNVYPTLFFVGKDGRIKTHLLNFQDQGKLEEVIKELL